MALNKIMFLRCIFLGFLIYINIASCVTHTQVSLKSTTVSSTSSTTIENSKGKTTSKPGKSDVQLFILVDWHQYKK